MNWNSSILWGIIGLVGGFLVALMFFIKGKKRQKITYKIDTYHLISNRLNMVNVDGLKITYNSIEIDDLYSSTISIINTGNTVINKSDLAPKRPISLSTKERFLLNQNKDIHLQSTNKSSNITPLFYYKNGTDDCNKIIIDFDFLAPKQAVVCTLLHTDKINFDGDLKEGKISNGKLSTDYIPQEKKEPIIIPKLLYYITYLTGLISLLMLAYKSLMK